MPKQCDEPIMIRCDHNIKIIVSGVMCSRLCPFHIEAPTSIQFDYCALFVEPLKRNGLFNMRLAKCIACKEVKDGSNT